MLDRIVISNTPEALDELLPWLTQVKSRLDVPDDLFFKIDLVINEAIPNVLSYAYRDDQTHLIELSITAVENAFTLTIEDDGIQFNPLTREPHHEADTLDEATIGGRGIHLMKAFSDSQSYHYTNGRNNVQFTFLKSNH